MSLLYHYYREGGPPKGFQKVLLEVTPKRAFARGHICKNKENLTLANSSASQVATEIGSAVARELPLLHDVLHC